MSGVHKEIGVTERSEIIRLLRSNQVIEAIKVYRSVTGAGLAESKAAVEAIGKAEGIERPKVRIEQNVGGLIILMIAALGAILVVWLLMKLF